MKTEYKNFLTFPLHSHHYFLIPSVFITAHALLGVHERITLTKALHLSVRGQ